ncbi:DUF5009 domain-containing protein [Alteromonas sediminis]|uniref:DUF5009 domain-containing protein n=1 Tax=Alteromonas sediminis TaxID=2259342 RepID=A0A3N5XZC5_9ALTE|nr:DUF5009 domain-containing protein [Alteromonas sediminis]RPJ65853.1 DUF5009 domain-containing protein [Alteromonas sediminis]
MQSLPNNRILSIDVFRGFTILVMVFVNELAGIANIPDWMKHMPADADAMTFVDLVFPAFLFIVGMSIPFAVQARENKGDNPTAILKHGLIRAFGLIVIGFYMVNSIGGYDESAMPISIALWSLVMYFSVLALWSSVPKHWSAAQILSLRSLGTIGLLAMAWVYEGPNESWMTPQWWGILGLIGWAYIASLLCYLLAGQRVVVLSAIGLSFIGLFALLERLHGQEGLIGVIVQENRNNTHIALVLSGLIMSLICFSPRVKRRGAGIFLFVAITGLLAYAACLIWDVSKIWATPSWALLSVFYCASLYAIVYWVVEVKHYKSWCALFEPAANNPLLIYILPYILLAAMGTFGWTIRPDVLSSGVAGILWSAVFAITMMALVAGLNKLGVRLKL